MKLNRTCRKECEKMEKIFLTGATFDIFHSFMKKLAVVEISES